MAEVLAYVQLVDVVEWWAHHALVVDDFANVVNIDNISLMYLYEAW